MSGMQAHVLFGSIFGPNVNRAETLERRSRERDLSSLKAYSISDIIHNTGMSYTSEVRQYGSGTRPWRASGGARSSSIL